MSFDSIYYKDKDELSKKKSSDELFSTSEDSFSFSTTNSNISPQGVIQLQSSLCRFVTTPLTLSSFLTHTADLNPDTLPILFYQFCAKMNCTQEALLGLIDHEIRIMDDDKEFFTSSSAVANFLDSFNLRAGANYYSALLSTVFKALLQQDLGRVRPGTFESQSPEFRKKLGELFFVFIKLLTGSVQLISPEQEMIFSILTKRMSNKFSKTPPHVFLARFFARFLAPALAKPSYFFVDVAPAFEYLSSIMAYLLRRLAMGEWFESEDMKKTNDVLLECQPYFQIALKDFGSQELTPEQSEILQTCRIQFGMMDRDLVFDRKRGPQNFCRLRELVSYFLRILTQKYDLMKDTITAKAKEGKAAIFGTETLDQLRESLLDIENSCAPIEISSDPDVIIQRNRSSTGPKLRRKMSPLETVRADTNRIATLSDPSLDHFKSFSSNPSDLLPLRWHQEKRVSISEPHKVGFPPAVVIDSEISAVSSLEKSLNLFLLCPVAMRSFFEIDHGSTLNETVAYFYGVCSMYGLASIGVTAVSEYEVECKTEDNLFLPNSPGSLFIKKFIYFFGTRYLRPIVGSFLYAQVSQLNEIKDLIHAGEQEGVQIATCQSIESAFRLFLKMLVGSVDTLPPQLVNFCSCLTVLMTKKFGETFAKKVIIRFFFLDFLCPTLTSTDELHLATNQPMKRLLQFVAKMVEALASGTTFEEENMKFANQSVAEGHQFLDLFLVSLCELEEENRELQMECFMEFGKHYQEPEGQIPERDDRESVTSFGKILLIHGYVMRKYVMGLDDLKSEEMEVALERISDLKHSFRKECPQLSLPKYSSSKTLSSGLLTRARSNSSSGIKKVKLSQRTSNSTLQKQEVVQLSLILRSHSHLLARTFLVTLIGIPASPLRLTFLMAVLLDLHGDPEGFFFVELRSELESHKKVALLMRETSPSVCLLKHLLEPFRGPGMALLQPLLKLGLKLTKSKCDLILNREIDEIEPKTKQLKNSLQRVVSKLLEAAENLPRGLCVICYRCVEVVRQNSVAERVERTPLSHWAVGAVIFLRYFIPMVATYSIEEESGSRNGLKLIGRLLMKLCCKTEFREANNSVVNEVLRDCFGLFDGFCEQVVHIGRDLVEAGRGVWEGGEEGPRSFLDASWKTELVDFLAKYKLALLDSVESDDLTTTLDYFYLIQKFQNILSSFLAKKSRTKSRKFGTKLKDLIHNEDEEFDDESHSDDSLNDWIEDEICEPPHKNILKEQVEQVVWAMESKGRLFVALLGGSDLGSMFYYSTIHFEDKEYITTNKPGPVAQWNEQFCFLVTDLRSTVIINLYEVDKKKKKDYHLASYSLPISELESGDIKREVLEICPEQNEGALLLTKGSSSEILLPTKDQKREGKGGKGGKGEKEKGEREGEKGKNGRERGLLYFHITFEGDDSFRQYLSLEKLLVGHRFSALEHLCHVVTFEDASSLANPLLAVLMWNEKVIEFFKRLLWKEIIGTQSMDLLFRGQTLVIKTLSLFANQVGKDYLIHILQHFFCEIESAEAGVEKFILSFQEDPANLSTHISFLLNWTTRLLFLVFASVPSIPVPILQICAYLKRFVIRAFSAGIHNVLSGFLFLRFLCPALATPETLPGLRANPPSDSLRRFLVLIAKLIQNLASLVEFGDKEGYMKCCNSYILEMKPKMINFYEQVSSKHSIRQPFTPERIPVQKHSYHLLHLYIVNYNVLDLLPKKKKKLRAELESVLALLGEPKQDQRPVEMLGYLDLEKIVEDLKNPEKGISTFGLHESDSKGKQKKMIRFAAFDLIDWLCVNVPICNSRVDAVSLGSRLMNYRFIVSSNCAEGFTDSAEFFEFADESRDTSAGKSVILNMREKHHHKQIFGESSSRCVQCNSRTKATIKCSKCPAYFCQACWDVVPILVFCEDGSPHVLGAQTRGEEELKEEIGSPLQFSKDLLETIATLFSQVSSLVENEIRPATLVSIRDDPKFKIFTLNTCYLQNIDFTLLHDQNDKAAFWLNIYHTLVLHAYIERGASTSSKLLAKFLQTSSYNVGGYVVSLNEIEHAILRAPLPTPKSASSLPGGRVERFKKKDPRRELPLTKSFPLLSFALNCGSKSCPDIAIYTGSTLRNSLRRAASRYLARTFSVRKENGSLVVRLPKLFVWFSRDLGEDKSSVLRQLMSFMGPLPSDLMTDLGKILNANDKNSMKKLKVEHIPFDWTFCCNLALVLSGGKLELALATPRV